MGTLLQLMALPAACMLFAWARGGGALAAVLRRIVSMTTVGDATRARLAPGTALGPAMKAGKAGRASGRPFWMRNGGRKDGRHIARNPVAPRIASIDAPMLRLRRIPPRWITGSNGC